MTQKRIDEARNLAEHMNNGGDGICYDIGGIVTALLAYIDEQQAEIEQLRKYEEHSKALSKLDDCNTCADRIICEHIPELGSFVRINCFAWRGERSERNERKIDKTR